MSPKQKGWFHTFVALAAVAEYFSASTRARKFLLGICTGYHLQAAYGHFMRDE